MLFYCKLTIFVAFLLTINVLFSSAEKQKCVREFLEWCKKNEYNSKEEDTSGSVSMHSSNVNGELRRIYCTVDYEGTDCLNNKKPWYHCYPDGTLDYKGETLTLNSESDDDICVAKNQAVDSGNNVKFNRTAFNIQMDKFRSRMIFFQKDAHEQMEDVNRRLARIGLEADFVDADAYDY